jgi:hypothetical protein
MGKMSPPHIRRRAAAQNDGGGVFPVAGADGTSEGYLWRQRCGPKSSGANHETTTAKPSVWQTSYAARSASSRTWWKGRAASSTSTSMTGWCSASTGSSASRVPEKS